MATYKNIKLKTLPTRVWEVFNDKPLFFKEIQVYSLNGQNLFDVLLFDGGDWKVYEKCLNLRVVSCTKQQIKDLLAAVDQYPSLIQTLS